MSDEMLRDIPWEKVQEVTRHNLVQVLSDEMSEALTSVSSGGGGKDLLREWVEKDFLLDMRRRYPELVLDARDLRVSVERMEGHSDDQGDEGILPNQFRVEVLWWPDSQQVRMDMPESDEARDRRRYDELRYGVSREQESRIVTINPDRIRVPLDPILVDVKPPIHSMGRTDLAVSDGVATDTSLTLECTGWDTHERAWIYGVRK